MTTNPSIPEAAIDAAVQRQVLNDGLWARELTERQLTNRRQDAEKVLRAAFPHLVGELVDAAELVCATFVCDACGLDASCSSCALGLRKLREALRALEPSEEER